MMASVFWPRSGSSKRTPGLLQGLQFRIPGDDRLNLLGGERRENEMRIHRLPCRRLGFIKRQSEQVLMRL